MALSCVAKRKSDEAEAASCRQARSCLLAAGHCAKSRQRQRIAEPAVRAVGAQQRSALCAAAESESCDVCHLRSQCARAVPARRAVVVVVRQLAASRGLARGLRSAFGWAHCALRTALFAATTRAATDHQHQHGGGGATSHQQPPGPRSTCRHRCRPESGLSAGVARCQARWCVNTETRLRTEKFIKNNTKKHDETHARDVRSCSTCTRARAAVPWQWCGASYL
jgi:hypothetical protein